MGSLTFNAKCSGGCGASIAYTLHESPDGTMPDLMPEMFRVAYAGGHLCQGCHEAVEIALSARRKGGR